MRWAKPISDELDGIERRLDNGERGRSLNTEGMSNCLMPGF